MNSKKIGLTALAVVVSLLLSAQQAGKWTLVIHGGAGGAPKNLTEAAKKSYEKHLEEALRIGVLMLKNGESALNVTQKVVNYMEDCPLFNAGNGAVMTIDGIHELDADKAMVGE